MEKLKLGLIGCGAVAVEKYLLSAEETGLAEIVAFCDANEKRAVDTAAQYGKTGAKVFTDYRRLLEEKLDAVYVCTPNRSHSEIAVAALESGKHVMCEKPMAINHEEALKMCAAAKQTGKLLTIGYQNRYRADSLYLKKECEAGTLGEIYYARAKAVRRRAVPTWGVFLNEFEQGGGPLVDIGTHALDLTLWLMDNYRPRSVTGAVYHKLNEEKEQANAFGPWDPEVFKVEDSAVGFITMENGATVYLESSWALNVLDEDEAKAVLCGTKAGADMNDGLAINGARFGRLYTARPMTEPGESEFFPENEDTPEVKEQKVFLNAILGNGELTVLPEQAAVVTQILDAIYLSAKEKRQIIL
jgi:predicted dehydrogenase